MTNLSEFIWDGKKTGHWTTEGAMMLDLSALLLSSVAEGVL